MDEKTEESDDAVRRIDQSVIEHVQSLLHHIEDHGGEYQQGREAVERLKQSLEYTTPSAEVPVMEQMRRIREALERVETKVARMSEESLGIVSSSVAAAAQQRHSPRDE